MDVHVKTLLSKLRTKQLRHAIEYIVIAILKLLFLWDYSTMVQSSQDRAGTNVFKFNSCTL